MGLRGDSEALLFDRSSDSGVDAEDDLLVSPPNDDTDEPDDEGDVTSDIDKSRGLSAIDDRKSE